MDASSPSSSARSPRLMPVAGSMAGVASFSHTHRKTFSPPLLCPQESPDAVLFVLFLIRDARRLERLTREQRTSLAAGDRRCVPG